MTKEELKQTNPDSILLVDIREMAELLLLPALPNAIHIPMKTLVLEAEKGTLPKDKKIVTVCRSGARCIPTNRILTAHGYSADLLEGGMVSVS